MFRNRDVELIAKRALAILMLIYALTTLPYLTTFPPVDNVGDESWMLNIAWNILDHGTPVASTNSHSLAISASFMEYVFNFSLQAGETAYSGHPLFTGHPNSTRNHTTATKPTLSR